MHVCCEAGGGGGGGIGGGEGGNGAGLGPVTWCGGIDVLRRHGVADKNLTIYRAPGAFELPLLASKVAASGKHDAIVALGAVIRGGTPHFEYVAGECVKGLSQVSLDAGMPVSFGVLTVDSIEQAIERSGTKAGNKGAEAAISALEMLNLLAKV